MAERRGGGRARAPARRPHRSRRLWDPWRPAPRRRRATCLSGGLRRCAANPRRPEEEVEASGGPSGERGACGPSSESKNCLEVLENKPSINEESPRTSCFRSRVPGSREAPSSRGSPLRGPREEAGRTGRAEVEGGRRRWRRTKAPDSSGPSRFQFVAHPFSSLSTQLTFIGRTWRVKKERTSAVFREIVRSPTNAEKEIVPVPSPSRRPSFQRNSRFRLETFDLSLRDRNLLSCPSLFVDSSLPVSGVNLLLPESTNNDKNFSKDPKK